MVERLELFSTPRGSGEERPEAERVRGTFLSLPEAGPEEVNRSRAFSSPASQVSLTVVGAQLVLHQGHGPPKLIVASNARWQLDH
jgi:hypothetical protein